MDDRNASHRAQDPFAESLHRNVEDTTEALVQAAATGAPGALAAVLIDAAEQLCGSGRATLWRRARAQPRPGDTAGHNVAPPSVRSSGGLGSGAWMRLRSRGETTPNPDALASEGLGAARFGVLHGCAIGSLVYERLAFDDGRRDAREDALESLFTCADVLGAGDPDATSIPSALPSVGERRGTGARAGNDPPSNDLGLVPDSDPANGGAPDSDEDGSRAA
ncbi:MAG: hypothetical protein AAFU73_21125 [Planctomycetota bacterium]